MHRCGFFFEANEHIIHTTYKPSDRPTIGRWVGRGDVGDGTTPYKEYDFSKM